MNVKPIPDGYHTITPYLSVSDINTFIEFLINAFDGKVSVHIKDQKGNTHHAEVKIGDSILMIGQQSDQSTPASFYIYTENTDAVYEKALKHGGESIMAPADQFYGDRNAGVKDPAGNAWWIATHIEDISSEEMQKRMAEQKK